MFNRYRREVAMPNKSLERTLVIDKVPSSYSGSRAA